MPPFINPMDSDVGTTFDYGIGLAVPDRSYCHVIGIDLIDIKLNGTSNNDAAFFDPSC